MSDTNTTKMLDPKARKTGLNLSILSLVGLLAMLLIPVALHQTQLNVETGKVINAVLDLLLIPVLIFPLLGAYFLLQSHLLKHENNARTHTHLDLVLKYIRFLLIGFGVATSAYVISMFADWKVSVDSYMAFIFIILAGNFYYYMISEEKLEKKKYI